MYRYVFNTDKSFSAKKCNIADIEFARTPIKTAEDLLEAIEHSVKAICMDGKAALALSGGIDSAILAKFLPKGTKTYTFKCIVPGKRVVDETEQAHYWAEICGLEHHVVDIYWEDVESVSLDLMKHKGAPIHSIEAQIYIAAREARTAGMTKFIFGENADAIYGGFDSLLAKEWLISEFVERYSYIMPYKALKDFQLILAPYKEFEKNGYVDVYGFLNKYYRQESLGSYHNACELAGIAFEAPYAATILDVPIDYNRIRNGDSKYIVKEAFNILYPNEPIPNKIPMPRPMNEWLENWKGPEREEFWQHCTDGMTGDQKWMLWALEKYLNFLDK